MRVYILTFDSRQSLTRAFDAVLTSPDVASCMIEAERVRIRFVAPEEAAETLLGEIYEDGGMRWCTRHSVAVSSPGAA